MQSIDDFDYLSPAETRLKPRVTDFGGDVQEIFARANFIRDVGYTLEAMAPGACVSRLLVKERHLQQNNFIHAGVLSTMADHTAGAAAGTLVGHDQVVLTVEFKVNLLRPALGEELICRARVLKNGKSIVVAESEVYTIKKTRPKLVAKATVTLAIVGANYE